MALPDKATINKAVASFMNGVLSFFIFSACASVAHLRSRHVQRRNAEIAEIAKIKHFCSAFFAFSPVSSGRVLSRLAGVIGLPQSSTADA